MICRRYIGRIIFWYGVACLAGVLFLYAFFPIGGKLNVKVTDPPSYVEDVPVDGRNLWRPHVQQLVLLVIDALRMDFISAEHTPFMWGELVAERGCLLTAHVDSPTVTMPRIKAMTTGAVPQFADLLLNLASDEMTHDSFLRRAHDLRLNMSFYGDDTWLKLFPGVFMRSEGVSSFYVQDYTEVDRNVSRHLERELALSDWQLLILHYLGLDHIGHVHGPRSPLVRQKLREMDAAAQFIAGRLDASSLLVVTGDHGMAEAGGHGGSSGFETTVPLLALGQPCGGGPSHVRQTDLAGTMSALLGVPLPAHSVGRVLPQLLPQLTTDKPAHLYLLHYSALALFDKLPTGATARQYLTDCARHYGRYLRDHTQHSSATAMNSCEEALTRFVESLSGESSKQSIPYLYISCTVLMSCVLSLTLAHDSSLHTQFALLLPLAFTVEYVVGWPGLFSGCVAAGLLACRACDCAAHWWYSSSSLAHPVLCGSAVALVSFASTSFIEEEHQTWYFLCGTFALLSAWRCLQQPASSLPWLGTFAGLRALRTLNQVGDRWASLPDFSDWLQRPEHASHLLSLHAVSLTVTWWLLGRCARGRSACWLSALSLALTLAHAWAPTAGWRMVSARLCWLTAAAAALAEYRAQVGRASSMTALALGWSLYVALLLRPHNVPLLAACHAVCGPALLGGMSLEDSTSARALAHAWFASAFLFMQGTCNSLASVDVAAGYAGLTDYLPVIVGLQLVSHTYAFPVLTALLLLLAEDDKKRWEVARTLAALRTGALVYTCLVTVTNRHHLFVWSVFSPKLLFETAHTFVLFLTLLVVACVDLLYTPGSPQ